MVNDGQKVRKNRNFRILSLEIAKKGSIFHRGKGSLISKGILTLIPLSKKVQNQSPELKI